MLQLSLDQQRALESLRMKQDLARVGTALAQAFPTVAARLGEQMPALLQHGQQRAHALGLRHGLCLARYLSAWFVFGADFETQPGFEWANRLLNTSTSEGTRVFQLGRRCVEELRTRAGVQNSMTAAELEQALQLLDAQLAPIGALGTLTDRERLKLGEACDIDVVQIELLDAQGRQAYVVDERGQWRLQGIDLTAAICKVEVGRPMPPQLHLLSHAPGRGPHAKLRVRTRMQACCDALTHPLLAHNTAQGRRELRSARAMDWTHALSGEVAPDGVAVEASPVLSELALSSCGLRNSGPVLGTLSTRIAVYPAEQNLLVWRREMPGAIHLPGDILASPPTRVHQKRDDVAIDATRWQTALATLDTAVTNGLQSLWRAWERNGLEEAQLHAEPAVMAGNAGLAWGWMEAERPLQDPPWMRVCGALDLQAWHLDLRLTGRLRRAETLTLVTLRSQGAAHLKTQWERKAADADLAAAVKALQISFRHPVEIELQPLVQAQAAHLHRVGTMSAAITGSAGLRTRPDGAGLQWFVQVVLEPVRVGARVLDPLTGEQTLAIDLLPAMSLVDWSAA